MTLPMKLRTEPLPGAPSIVAYFRGPVLLAGLLGKEGIETLSPWTKTRVDYDQVPIQPAPVIVGADDDLDAYVRKGAAPGTFILESGVLRTPGKITTPSITLVPFYKAHFERYAVYWNKYSDEEWRTVKKDFEAAQAKLAALEARTVDSIRLGEMQPEREHALESDKSRAGVFEDVRWREAGDGGWFAFDLKADETAAELLCAYWGSDKGREFDILIDGVKLAGVKIEGEAPGEWFEAVYPVPAQLVKGKTLIKVKFQPAAGKRTARVSSVRLMRPEK